LAAAKRPLVIAGAGCGSLAVIQATGAVAAALCRVNPAAGLTFVLPECNGMGMAFLPGDGLEAAVQAVRTGQADTVIILEADVYRALPAEQADALLAAANVIVLDHLTNATVAKASAVLPAATFADSDGTLVSNEGRAQRFFQAMPPVGEVKAAWRWLGELSALAGKTPINPWQSLDDVLAALAEAIPQLKTAVAAAPAAEFRAHGQRVPRQPHRYSGRTAITANLDVHEPKPPDDVDAPMSFSMEGFDGSPPAALIGRFWAPGWNSVQAITKFQQEVAGPLLGGDPGVRLIEPCSPAAPGWESCQQRTAEGPPAADATWGEEAAVAPAPAFVSREGLFLVVAAYHVFGSEELSVLSPGIAQRAPRPYVLVNPADAERAGLTAGGMVTVSFVESPGAVAGLVVRVDPGVALGVAMAPVGLPGLTTMALPAWAKLTKT
jgi:NADH-quinone oxidoreductase subunit G